MRLILGPPGSGKTSYCVSLLRDQLRQKRNTCRLIVPTATMAEHLRNELAREGFVFKPALVSTFTKFIEPYLGSVPGLPAGALDIVVGEVLGRSPLTRYSSVRRFPGFRASIVHAIEEFSSAGGAFEDLASSGAEPDFLSIYSATLEALAQRKLHLRADQLRHAAARILEIGAPGVEELIFAGFYSFTAPETGILQALATRVKLTVALSDWAGAQPSVDALGGAVERVEASPSGAHRTLCVAPTIESEVAEIARRIVAAHENGRPWREMGVIVRNEALYVPALQSAFARFGVPARFYFSSQLADVPVVRYFGAIVSALLSGWDHALTLQALRLPGARLEGGSRGDQFEFDVLARLPGQGLDGLREIADDTVSPVIDELDRLTFWNTGKVYPHTWAQRLQTLRGFFASPELQDGCSADIAMLWRSHAAALDSFEAACSAAAAVLDAGVPLTLEEFWNYAEAVIASTELRVPDHRRDVVHVIDVFEARQWQLPVVFICGLLEKQFPKYQTEDPILPDDIRRRLQAREIHVRTSQQRQSDERFLFDLAVSRGSEAVVLTYPQLNAKGDANLPSFFLSHAKPFVEDRALDVRMLPARPRAPEPTPSLAAQDAMQELLARNQRFTPTGIETYLQCPFQFFARRTLKLSATPEQPWERLNALVQGNIVHQVLERSQRASLAVADVFDDIFDEHCRQAHVPEGYRTEAIRLELLHNLEMMEADSRLARGVRALYEEPFVLRFAENAPISGIIDRVEIDRSGAATVIDYKYKSKQSLDRTLKGHDERTAVQGGLYLLAVEQMGYRPAGMVYCGIKREVSFGGWMLAPHNPEIRQTCEPAELANVIRQAREDTAAAIKGIREGSIEPQPADEAKCDFCEYAMSCRYEVAAMRRAAIHRTAASGAGASGDLE